MESEQWDHTQKLGAAFVSIASDIAVGITLL